MITAGLSAFAAYGIYRGFNQVKEKKPKRKNEALKIAYGYYEVGFQKLADYVAKNRIFYYASVNQEKARNGLLIEEAYYGLADHIYALDSHREGYENFKKPTSI